MPNHVRNRIELKGDQKLIDLLVKEIRTTYPEKQGVSYSGDLTYSKIGGEHEYGWLNVKTNIFTIKNNNDKIVGVPEGYEPHMEKGWSRFPDFEKIVSPPNDDAYNDKPNQEIARLSPNWWNTWNIENWGTKWNCYDCEKESENVYLFDTAWSGVKELIHKMSLKHPLIEIFYQYSCEDTGYNCGELTYGNGVVMEKHIENGSVQAYELAFKLRPDNKEYYKLVDGNYVYNEDED